MPTHSLYLTTSQIPYGVGSVPTIASILGIESQPVYNSLTVPSAPTILNILTADSQILVLFIPNNPDENSIITDYQYSIDGGNTFITMITPTSPYIISNLINGVTYDVQIKALNAIGEGSPSNIVSVTPKTTPSNTIINSIITGDGTAFVDVTITNNGGSEITNYKYSLDNGVTFTSFSPAQTSNPLTITGLTNGNTYDIVIKAVNIRGDGIASNSQSVYWGVVLATNIINQYTTASIWLDTSTPSSNFVLSGSNVNSWLDKTSNSYNLSKVGTITYNAISPTSVLIPAGSYFRQTNYNMLTSRQTWFFVISTPTAFNDARVVGMNTSGTSSNGYGFDYLITQSNRFYIYNHGTTNDGIGFDYNFTANTMYLFSISLNLNVSTSYATAIANTIMRLNGTTKTLYSTAAIRGYYNLTSNIGTTTSLLVGAIGVSGSYFPANSNSFNIHEMIGINSQALGINDIRTMETYLNTKWNLGYTIT